MSIEYEKFNIKDELQKLPNKPGAYLMKDKDGVIIYVGKAVNLKKRVTSYFQKSEKIPRIKRMVSKIKSFEYIVANDERDAFIIECNLIKNHMPYFNVMLKDDKTYPYIKVSVNQEFPKISVTRRIKNDNARYFGPYPQIASARKALDVLQKNFPVRNCNKKVMGKDERPCLNYQIKRCLGPCANLCTKEEYQNVVKDLLNFLDGKSKKLISDIKHKMIEASNKMDFESAALYRDRVNMLRRVSDNYYISVTSKRTDVISCALDKELLVVYILNVNEGAIFDRHQFEIDSFSGTKKEAILSDFIRQYYSKGNVVPKIILVDCEIENEKWLSNWLSNLVERKVEIHMPKKGEKKRLTDLAHDNAKHVLNSYIERKVADKTNLVELAKALHLEEVPNRIEAFDISNMAGKDTVASMIVFENGKPKKSMYRKFIIKNKFEHDDLKAMEEVISRRISHFGDEKFGAIPSLLMIDGGNNQVNIVEEVVNKSGYDIAICGMVKDNKHVTRGLVYNGNEFGLKVSSSLFRFVAAIQNEAHRFAIEFNRNKRKSRYFDSELESIKGIGKKRRDDLIKHFGSLREIRVAGINQLEAVPGINKKTAKIIYEYFHGDK